MVTSLRQHAASKYRGPYITSNGVHKIMQQRGRATGRKSLSNWQCYTPRYWIP